MFHTPRIRLAEHCSRDSQIGTPDSGLGSPWQSRRKSGRMLEAGTGLLLVNYIKNNSFLIFLAPHLSGSCMVLQHKTEFPSGGLGFESGSAGV